MEEEKTFSNVPSVFVKGALASIAAYLIWEVWEQRKEDVKVKRMRKLILEHREENNKHITQYL